jgi:hypothetical protein
MCVTLWSLNGVSAGFSESPNGAEERDPSQIQRGCLTSNKPMAAPRCDFLLGRHGSAATEHLGHKSVETTMIYTHVMRNLASTAVSPLDALEGG